ncbi:MAG: Holliday junction branch migration protein RuvA [Flavobacteriaceae bacterium]|jgi:Holliday junction DNA helicase RuvA|nr:Holliday junction branch migration protein RuvA [Flavobacteriaceae bacterium]|tara:strand:+ start:67 stop:648 length:582 start_codon:yes stop_codon:yes gene_type:complete
MITQLRGRLVEKSPTSVVIDCQGVGYLVNISLFTFGQLTDEENIQLFTHLQVREDAHTLYGFTTDLERQLFRLLIGISGIGANTARTMLSSLSPSEIGQAIQGEQVDVIQSVKGIGAKTAQRVVIELRDKIQAVVADAGIPAVSSNTNREEALSALVVLGYQTKSCVKVIDELLSMDAEMSVERLIRNALNKL